MRLHSYVRTRGRPPSGGRWLEPTRQRVQIDDLKNPEYRKGRRQPQQQRKAEPQRPPSRTEDALRAQYAAKVARAEFGRFYWNDELRRRMERELQSSRRRHREAAELARRRRQKGK